MFNLVERRMIANAQFLSNFHSSSINSCRNVCKHFWKRVLPFVLSATTTKQAGKAERKDEFDTVFVFNSQVLGNFRFVCC